jgi:ubiquinone biosynthesis protein
MALHDEGGDEALEAAQPGIDLTLALRRFVEASLHQLFVTGFFHGDPHPGNILITPENRIAFVDFGIYGEMPPWHRDKMLRMVESLALGDFYRAYRCYADLGDATDATDPVAFKRDAMELLEAWYAAQRTEGLSIAERSLGRYCMGMVTLVRRHGMSMGYETLLCWRAMISLDATLQRFWGRLDFNDEVARFFMEHAGGPLRQIEGVMRDPAHSAAVWRLTRDAPRHALAILEVARGEANLFVSESEAPAQRRGLVRQARATAASLVAISALVLAGGLL